MHGGSVTAHSAGPGTGCEFVVRLPALPAIATGRSVPEPGSRGEGETSLPRRRILVVDDNIDGATSLAKLLERFCGQEVRVAHDGPGALEAAGEFLPEVVLLDIGMPSMDGHEVARRLRERPEFRSTPIVALTGWGQESDRRNSQQAGFDRHLVKPVALDVLRELLAGLGPSERG
jgi:CheY-like chemotaxis protein